ncbi:MAG TPA: hypothetical protein HPP58_05495 [Deltaproteobacteria bacterium]|jgi:hypothetical protein|nr:hypothetical protein [Deltaproteobacteria bacterium]HIJ36976.1 hypothetical protein [Deltaproteobacteria bacterium]HIJ42050.1 hypothetical protein [Deltaproteobacteria bacterium]
MGDLIRLEDRIKGSAGSVISSGPWEFRKPLWRTLYFTQFLRALVEETPCDSKAFSQMPPHFVLKGGLAYTILSMYANRKNEREMREIYYLIGLMDCMINQVNAILRTDLLRSMYKQVFAMKEKLNLHWHGTLDRVLLPIDPQLFNDLEYRSLLNRAGTMKELYQTIRQGTETMFDTLAGNYVFFCPGGGEEVWNRRIL